MKSFFFVIAALLSVSGIASANLVVNGGFETGDFTGWTTNPISFPQFIVTSPVNSGSFAAQIAGFSSHPDTLTQTIATAAGQTYQLSFARSQAGGGPTISLNVTWDGVSVFSELNPGAQPYQTFTASVVGTGSDTLVFTSANDPAYTFLDDVSLNASTNPTPEPSAFALLGVATFGLIRVAAGRRRRQR